MSPASRRGGPSLWIRASSTCPPRGGPSAVAEAFGLGLEIGTREAGRDLLRLIADLLNRRFGDD